MKRLSSADSIGVFMSVCQPTDQSSPRNHHLYGRDFQMLDGFDDDGCVEEAGPLGEKKRRLSADQVKSLEKNFEMENKLEPERKAKLAQELGLQPRQVAVWFQNRRARWKTKQLERDYNVLKVNYDTLKLNYETLQHDHETLLNEIRELKMKMGDESSRESLTAKTDMVPSEPSENLLHDSPVVITSVVSSEHKDPNINGGSSLFPELKDGSSDSDSSAVFNEENSPRCGITSEDAHNRSKSHVRLSPPSPSLKFNSAPFNFPFSKVTTFPSQFVRLEEHNFFSGEEACGFFPDDPGPAMPWYCHEQWN